MKIIITKIIITNCLLIPINHEFSLCLGINCENIKEIFIPQIVDACTKDLPVFIEDSTKNKKLVFLTESGSLKAETEETDCSQIQETFSLDNIIIKRFHNKVSIESSQIKKTLTSSKANSQVPIETTLLYKVKTVQDRLCESLECLYEKYVDSNATVKMIRDFFELLLCLAVFLFFVFKAKDIPEGLKYFKKFISKRAIFRGKITVQEKVNAENVSIELKDNHVINNLEKLNKSSMKENIFGSLPNLPALKTILQIIPEQESSSLYKDSIIEFTEEALVQEKKNVDNILIEMKDDHVVNDFQNFRNKSPNSSFTNSQSLDKKCKCLKECVRNCSCKKGKPQKCSANCSCNKLICKNQVLL